jgi:5-methylcytosine-specific restriction endonuclease McrBC GTP-binding regulatory subunit McrB
LKADNKEQKINNIAKDLNWYSAIALSMYQNGKNNKYKVPNLQYQKIIKAFAQDTDNKHIENTIYNKLSNHISPNAKYVNTDAKYTANKAPYIFDKTENSEWYLTDEGVRFVEENLSEQLEQLNSKNSQREIEDFYKFITFHQSYSYEEFVEGIKPHIDTDTENSTISYEYNKGIFKEICQQANSDPDNNYLLIIDEINRGNISKIFGELITLIETDKRVTPNGERIFENTKVQNEQLLVTLPYTKSKFGVPKNLYILGTMNTSDRSIASIDIALRRRFKFIEMMPNKDLVADFGIGFADIFENLNTKIKILLDRDHQIGHSYFIKTKYENAGVNELKTIWFTEVLPLLNEYFYCDWEKLKLIIPAFIKKVEIPIALKSDCEEDIYEFKLPDEVDNFELALKQEKFE